MEQLEEAEELFNRTLFRGTKRTITRTGLSSESAVERIRAFTACANRLVDAHDRPHN